MIRSRLLPTALLALGLGLPAGPAVAGAEPVPVRSCTTAPLDVAVTSDPRLARSRAAFALALVTAVAGDGGGTVTVSPSGVATVLAALDIGADKAMKTAIAKTLGVGRGARGLEALRRAARYLRSMDETTEGFALMDALILDKGLTPAAGLLDATRSEAGVDAERVDLADPAVIDGINARVKRWTNGRIETIVEPGDHPSLLAVNAFSFQGCWAAPFDPAATRDEPFTTADGRTVPVKMMMREADDIRYVETGRIAAVELGYTDARFALVLVTTRDKPARPAEFKGEAALLSGAGFKTGKARLTLPRFGAATTTELLAPLAHLGLSAGLASPTSLARFGEGVKLDAIRQKTFLAIDETGTEAAAATAAMSLRGIDNSPFATLSFDKPFIYALRHRTTGMVLMAGYVGEVGG